MPLPFLFWLIGLALGTLCWVEALFSCFCTRYIPVVIKPLAILLALCFTTAHAATLAESAKLEGTAVMLAMHCPEYTDTLIRVAIGLKQARALTQQEAFDEITRTHDYLSADKEGKRNYDVQTQRCEGAIQVFLFNLRKVEKQRAGAQAIRNDFIIPD
ncbi:hypothetical protein [Uliginosibacterium gangwonense]|uniref:hypothetical protein n=1 Tax=Uliginosibacterium gangwonense TaxID=392736 RepID=UPI00037C0DB4|nr:hypothetical protein [Uliginosibacterium gangwonense]